MSEHEHEHDHEHEHHHEHEHGHGHTHHHEHSHENRLALGTTGFIDFTTHEEASVVSATGTIDASLEQAKASMNDVLQQLGQWVDANEGIIGHIKCSLKGQTVVGLSITYDEVQEKQSEARGITMSFASIVFGIAPDVLRDKAAELLRPLVS